MNVGQELGDNNALPHSLSLHPQTPPESCLDSDALILSSEALNRSLMLLLSLQKQPQVIIEIMPILLTQHNTVIFTIKEQTKGIEKHFTSCLRSSSQELLQLSCPFKLQSLCIQSRSYFCITINNFRVGQQLWVTLWQDDTLKM